MKVKSSLKSRKNNKDCVLVRRRSKLFAISKKNPRLKTRQGK